jgi:UDP-N-acetylmuramate dehydrogenase
VIPSLDVEASLLRVVAMETREKEAVLRTLERACPGGIRLDEPMARHTTIGTGGPARFFAVPKSRQEVVSLVRAALGLGIDYMGVGRGSNLLVRDGGYNGLVIKIAGNMAAFVVYKRTAHAEAGVSFTRLGRVLTRSGRAGFEFAVGIPGSVGGAVRMNAGAWGREVAGVLQSVKIADGKGRTAVLGREELGFVYRGSNLPERSIVLSAVFNCPPGAIDEERLRQSMSRGETQPVSQRSFGSAFKNPPGGFAGRMIDECGLKGTRRGGVMVSEKHANFLVNVGEDTKANDIEDLIGWIVERVEAKFHVRLSPEVIIIGDR